jgi:hypothetical protein
MKCQVLLSSIVLLTISIAWAAPEDRGPRGTFISLGGGALIGQATDEDGRSTGSHTGSNTHLRFGEEVIPGLTLGLEMGGGSLNGLNDKYTGQFGGLFIQAGWRPFEQLQALQFLFGTGVGGGSLVASTDEGFEGDVAGALYSLATQYEFKFGEELGSGFILAPYVRGIIAPQSGASQAQIYTTVIGLESGWHFGR